MGTAQSAGLGEDEMDEKRDEEMKKQDQLNGKGSAEKLHKRMLLALSPTRDASRDDRKKLAQQDEKGSTEKLHRRVLLALSSSLHSSKGGDESEENHINKNEGDDDNDDEEDGASNSSKISGRKIHEKLKSVISSSLHFSKEDHNTKSFRGRTSVIRKSMVKRRRHTRTGSKTEAIVKSFKELTGSKHSYEEDDILHSYLNKSEHSGKLRSFHIAKSSDEAEDWMHHMSHFVDTSGSDGSDTEEEDDSKINNITSNNNNNNAGNLIVLEARIREIFFNALNSSKLFHGIDRRLVDELYEVTVEIKVKQGETLFRQGQTGSLMFVVLDGILLSYRKRKIHANVKTELGPGSVFCEEAMVAGLEHEDTVSVLSETATLLALHRIEFQMASIAFSNNNALEENGDDDGHLQQHVPLFSPLPLDKAQAIWKDGEVVEFSSGDVVLRPGSSFDGLYIVESGEVSFEVVPCPSDFMQNFEKLFSSLTRSNSSDQVTGVPYRWIGKGEMFGETSFLQEPYQSTSLGIKIVASGQLGKTRLRKLPMGELDLHLVELMKTVYLNRCLSKNGKFSDLSNIQISSIVELMHIVEFTDGKTIDGIDCLVMVLDGALGVFDEHDQLKAGIGQGECFGYIEMLQDKFLDPNRFKVKSCGITVCGIITDEIMEKLDLKMQSFEKQIICTNKETEEQDERTITVDHPSSPNDNVEKQTLMFPDVPKLIEYIEKSDLVIIRRIYTATLSKLYYAWHRLTGQIVCVKEIQNMENGLDDKNISHNAMKEIALLKNLVSSHPIVPRIIGQREMDRYTLVAMEPLLQDFETVLKEKPGLELPAFTFYAACAVNALKVLFEHGVLHRDIKPNNLMLDRSGYLRIIDFGVSKGNMNSETAKTCTLCGTGKYFAPELCTLIFGKNDGYGIAVDWWALGVTLFEFAVGCNPFEDGEESEENEVGPSFHLILHRILAFANSFTVFKSTHDQDSLDQVPESFPQSFQSLNDLDSEWIEAKRFIFALLNPTAHRRMGIVGGGPRIAMNHPLFQSISWVDLNMRRIKPPITPEIPDYLLHVPSSSSSGPRRGILTRSHGLSTSKSEEEDKEGEEEVAIESTATNATSPPLAPFIHNQGDDVTVTSATIENDVCQIRRGRLLHHRSSHQSDSLSRLDLVTNRDNLIRRLTNVNNT